MLPESLDRRGLSAVGFVGWESWAQLRSEAFAPVPTGPAVYVVYRPAAGAPEFLKSNPGGRFKGKDPSVEQEVLTANWVQGANVVYIGKADNARRRLTQFARFGAGEPVGHWGGRLIWHLADSDQLLVAWHPITPANSLPDGLNEYLPRLRTDTETG